MGLLADALVDQHVRIDRHADREHDAGDAGQRQRRAEQRHRGEDEEDVHAERKIGEDPEDAVGREHVDDDQRAADQRRALAGVDRILAEARPDRALLDDRELGRQRAGAQQHGEIVGLLDREIAGNLARAAGDRAQDARRGNHLAVEHDRERRPDIVGGDVAERWPPRRLKRKFTTGSPVRESKPGCASTRSSPATITRFSTGMSPACCLRQHLNIAGRCASIGDEAELQLGGRAEEVLQLGRVLQARHLDQHAVDALLLDVGLLGAGAVEAAVEHLDRLRHCTADLVGDRRLR